MPGMTAAPAIVIAGAGECGTRAAAPDPAALADPGVALKSVLRSPVAGSRPLASR